MSYQYHLGFICFAFNMVTRLSSFSAETALAFVLEDSDKLTHALKMPRSTLNQYSFIIQLNMELTLQTKC